jgi:hypothetical protein
MSQADRASGAGHDFDGHINVACRKQSISTTTDSQIGFFCIFAVCVKLGGFLESSKKSGGPSNTRWFRREGDGISSLILVKIV